MLKFINNKNYNSCILQCAYRIIKYIIILMILSIFFFNIYVYADDVENENIIDYPEVVLASTDISEEPNINSRSAIIYDRNSKEIIWGKNEKEVRKMASTTKIMTAIVVIEKSNLEDIVTASKKAAGTGGSRLGLKEGDKISVNDLLYGLMLCSGNDAAVCLAEYVGGSLEGFAEIMNNKAKELSLDNTHFITPHGLDNDEHYTTAYELARLTDYALHNKTFCNIVGTKNYSIKVGGQVRNLSNTNELLGNFEGIYGVKTGFTNGANRCLVTSCKRDNLDIITVVLGADTKKFRTQDSVKLLKYAIQNFENIDLKSGIEEIFKKWRKEHESDIYVEKGVKNNIESTIDIPENTVITIKKGSKERINMQVNEVYFFKAPLNENQILGNIIIKYNDEIKMHIDIKNKYQIEKRNIMDYMKRFLANILQK